jgi:riboflavin biosynthesis pyrimidine reductase
MSLDGFVAAPNDELGRGLGDDGGASIAQQALQPGPVDELQLHVAPVVLGAARTLFGDLGTRLQLERTRVLDSSYATHFK